jgi:5-methylphenazine-1-carboxylate 1-monooxygenase
MRIVIIGGGIGGLALSLSLHDAGFEEIDVYESAPEMRALGVGINLLPHAVRELSELGLLPALSAAGIPTAELAYCTKRGERIWSEPRGLGAGYLWPQFSIHRGELLMLLYQAVIERLGPARVHLGHHLDRLGEPTSGGGWAHFIDRESGASKGRTEADVVVGADGVHSMVRAHLHPGEGPPKWNGITMWRGVTCASPFLSGRTMIIAGYFGRRVVVYPISRRHEDAGRALVNWVAELRTGDERPMPPHAWDHHGRREDVLDAFGSFRFDWLDVPDLLRRAEIIYQYPMVDRDPLPRWSFGPITLLGDAAHPMYPVGSNGASQAILDARALARALALSDTVGEALAAYEGERRPATSRIVLLNREVGPEQCMDIVEERAPDGFSRIEDVITREELLAIAERYKRVAGFDRETLNTRPSLSVGVTRRR